MDLIELNFESPILISKGPFDDGEAKSNEFSEESSFFEQASISGIPIIEKRTGAHAFFKKSLLLFFNCLFFGKIINKFF